MRCYVILSFIVKSKKNVYSGDNLVFTSIAGLTTAAMAEALKIQKIKMMMDLHKNHNGSEFDSDELNANTGRHASRTVLFCF